MGAKRLWHTFLDLIYPPHCLVCDDTTPMSCLCERCVNSFEPIPEPPCAVCGRPVETSACANCERREQETGQPWGFDHARAAAIYRGPLRYAIHRLKYDRKENLGLPLGAFLANRIAVDGLLSTPVDAVTAVPLHPSRERGRGYNQARLLAAPVAEILGVPLLPPSVVQRTRKSGSQVNLSDKARRTLAPETFTVSTSDALTGKRILLIDDVFTTGATVSACAAALKNAGAATVVVATLAAGG